MCCNVVTRTGLTGCLRLLVAESLGYQLLHRVLQDLCLPLCCVVAAALQASALFLLACLLICTDVGFG